MITDEDLPAIVAAYDAAGGVKAAAARAMGIPVETFKYNYARAERKNLTGNTPGGPVKAGYIQGRTTSLYKVHADGTDETKLVWVREDPEKKTPEQVLETVQAALIGFEHAPVIETPAKPTITDLQATYIITDEHLGLYSWARQTGQNYDLDIADRAISGSFYRLMQRTPDAECAFIAKLGDGFHMDNHLNRTEKSGNLLDVDTRWEKVLQQGVKINMRVIDMALTKHLRVKMRVIAGNHDPHTAYALSLILREHYADNPRFEMDVSPAPFSAYQWGGTMMGLHHGDTVDPKEFPGVMAAVYPKMWGDTEYRYAYSGHNHKVIKGKPITAGEIGGVEWEVFQAVAARDQWNASKGFTSKRSLTSILHHKDEGEVGRARTYIRGE